MTDWQGKNLLCYGDNLGFLTDTDLFPNECVDLIYLDPPFNSQQSYNVLFKEATGTPEAAQIKAFEDTWTWDMAANEALTRIHTDPAVPAPLVELMRTFMQFLKPSPMLAYLVQMAIRLVHMHRVLRPTGSLYLHCDPTASHYLKLVLDGVFGPRNFLNEIVWKRTHAHGSAKRFGPVHDIILFYAKSGSFTWTNPFTEHAEDYVRKHFRHADADGRMFQPITLTGSGVRHGDSGKPWHGIDPTKVSRHWAIPGKVVDRLRLPGATVQEKLDALEAARRIYWPKEQGGTPRLKWYVDELAGTAIPDVWNDISPIGAQAAERLGYPTQKPLELLKRIVSASSNPGGVIMDPFCGCGTTIDAVETLNAEAVDEYRREAIQAKEQGKKRPRIYRPAPRTWIGIDVTHLAINLIKHRLTRFTPPPVYEVIGEPSSVSGAEALGRQDPYQFQFWALGLIGARPWGGTKKKGADKGIDGVRFFMDEIKNGQEIYKKMLVQVKSGKVGVKDIRDLVGTMSREGAEMGVFLTLVEPTAPMKQEAASAGTYNSPWDGKPYPRVQVLTIEDLLADPYRPNPRCLRLPGGTSQHTLPDPPRHKGNPKKQGNLFGVDP